MEACKTCGNRPFRMPDSNLLWCDTCGVVTEDEDIATSESAIARLWADSSAILKTSLWILGLIAVFILIAFVGHLLIENWLTALALLVILPLIAFTISNSEAGRKLVLRSAFRVRSIMRGLGVVAGSIMLIACFDYWGQQSTNLFEAPAGWLGAVLSLVVVCWLIWLSWKSADLVVRNCSSFVRYLRTRDESLLRIGDELYPDEE